MGGKSDPPAAPNYAAAANATAEGNLANARYATQANRPNVYTPLGSQTWTNSGDRWNSYINLSPQAQETINNQIGLSNDYSSTAKDLMGSIPEAYANGFGPSDFGAYRKQINDETLQRLQPELDRQHEALRTQLQNQGITAGSDAWKNSQDDWSRRNNDLLLATDLQSGNAMQQALATQYQMQDRPLNIVNALRTGAQVQQPSFGNFAQQQATPGADLLGAANAQYGSALNNYNAQQAQGASTMGGLFGLGTALLGNPSFKLF